MKIVQQWDQKDSEFIRSKLVEYNLSHIPEKLKNSPNEKISFVVRDEEDNIVAGITGYIVWAHAHVDFLWVDESVRKEGYGTKLLKRIEEFAREKGCTFIFLETFSFQAPEFYPRNGYEVFGKLEDYSEGLIKYFLKKQL
ncbi:MAG TPA: GNAT family N-acetyltransferase [Niallia sp.]|nr:GNAT family N-acetyltransferase [Niallia sp.]